MARRTGRCRISRWPSPGSAADPTIPCSSITSACPSWRWRSTARTACITPPTTATLGEDHWRSRLPLPPADDRALGRDGAPAGERRGPADRSSSRMRPRCAISCAGSTTSRARPSGWRSHVCDRCRPRAAHGRPTVERAMETRAGVGPLPREVSRPRQPRLLQFEQGWLHDGGDSRSPVVQASVVRAALHLCGDDAAGDHRGGGAGRLASCRRCNSRSSWMPSTETPRSPKAWRPSCRRRRRPGVARVAMRQVRDRVDGRMAVYVENVATGERVAIDARFVVRDVQRDQGAADGGGARSGSRGPAVALGSHHVVGRAAAHSLGRALRAGPRPGADGDATCSR